MKTKHILSVLLLVMVCCASTLTYGQQNDSFAIAHADTTHFSPNKNEGWILFNSYLNIETADSVALEVIIRHDRNSINWNEDQFIGIIKTETMFPEYERNVICSLLHDQYNIRINTDGRCYIRLVEGSLPPLDPVTIPVQIKYDLND